MKKNGFTLIELLAVIVILAIIALIAFPAIGAIINTAKKGAFKSTSQGLADAANFECSNDLLDNKELVSAYTITNGNFGSGANLKIKGKLPDGGTISVNDKCEVSLSLHNENWCASKSFTDDDIKISDYIEGSCGSADEGSLTAKIKSQTGIQKGIDLGTNEYDLRLVDYQSDVDYYNSYYFTGLNPNNYIKVGEETFRILGVDSQGISIIGSSTKVNETNYDTYGIALNSKMIIANKSGGVNYINKNQINYSNDNIRSVISNGITFYDYDVTTDRQAFSTCIINKNLSDDDSKLDYINAFTDCSQTTWLSNLSTSVDLNLRLYDNGSSQEKAIYLNNGKLIYDGITDVYSSVNSCTDCVSYYKFYLRNDVQYVSGTGTSSDPYIYKANEPIEKFSMANYSTENLYWSVRDYLNSINAMTRGAKICVSLQTLIDTGFAKSPITDDSSGVVLNTTRTVTANVYEDGWIPNEDFSLNAINSTCP